MLTPADLGLLALVLFGLPLRAWFGMRRLRAAAPAQQVALRPALWLRGILTQWLMVGGVVLQWWATRRSFAALALVPKATWPVAGVLLGVALIVVMVNAQRRQLPANAELARRIRERLALAAPLLPHTRAEWPGFVPLAVTAGICEEILFRGFLIWALLHVIPSYPLVVCVQGILFGVAHAYQGPRGMLLTGMVGLFLGAVVWFTGSLWPAMAIHALMDLNAGDLAIRVLGEPPAAEGI